LNEDYLKQRIKDIRAKQYAEYQRKKRLVEMGYIDGLVHLNGSVQTFSPKGIRHWYDTRTLVKRVTEAFDRNEGGGSGRVCWINGRHQLQIRGKHLRRLLKAMPNVKQVGRKLVEEK
jgi:hypothetical protein